MKLFCTVLYCVTSLSPCFVVSFFFPRKPSPCVLLCVREVYTIHDVFTFPGSSSPWWLGVVLVGFQENRSLILGHLVLAILKLLVIAFPFVQEEEEEERVYVH